MACVTVGTSILFIVPNVMTALRLFQRSLQFYVFYIYVDCAFVYLLS